MQDDDDGTAQSCEAQKQDAALAHPASVAIHILLSCAPQTTIIDRAPSVSPSPARHSM